MQQYAAVALSLCSSCSSATSVRASEWRSRVSKGLEALSVVEFDTWHRDKLHFSRFGGKSPCQPHSLMLA